MAAAEPKVIEALDIEPDSSRSSSIVPSIKEKQEEEALSQTQQTTPEVQPTPTPAPVSPIPNGGLTAWLQVLGSFMLFFNSW